MSEERYVTVDQAVLAAIREFAWVADYDRHTVPAVRLLLRVARIDPVSGQVVFAVHLVRDLETPGEERGLGTI